MEANYIKIILIKELKELIKNKAFISYYVYLIIGIGIIVPIFSPFDTEGTVSTMMLTLLLTPALIIPSTLVADLFAGEKERKTLETLLGTPIDIKEMYLGKVLFVVLISITVLMVTYILNIITLNIVSQFIVQKWFYPFNITANNFIWLGGVGVITFVSTFGTLVSINSKNTKTCNLLVFISSAPIVSPLILMLNTPLLDINHSGVYGSSLMICSLLIFVYIALSFNKVKILNKSR
ncbi:ABC transporter permease subunit [Alkaliphilus hydrothermalis]|uniref:ABC-type Na+ efflux pump permease subunit n=1 Tax=Alkaliphilus hydrothermalis TaxID=1482730 RepID=A0ABS2NRV9_9FIRM|nr:ABC transporter permease subunit [Alkaliphilus hydrothermalis]MBM7615512.1 ABC-type Na+ efflux pump permease subunit [Alkaliphilus hydrothermalis]